MSDVLDLEAIKARQIDRKSMIADARRYGGDKVDDSTVATATADVDSLITELESLRSQLAAANERAERLDCELTAAIEAGAKIVGFSAAAAGYSTTNSEDEAKFMAMAGLDQTS